MAEKVVQITAGSGTNVRTAEVTLLQADGTRKVVEMQVMLLSDEDGNILGISENPIYVTSPRIESLLEKLISVIEELKLN